MANRATARVLSLAPRVVEDRSTTALDDMLGYFDPDAVWVHGPEQSVTATAKVRSHFEGPVSHPPLIQQGVDSTGIAGVAVVAVRSGRVLDGVHDEVVTDAQDGCTYLVCDDVDVATRPTQLTAELAYGDDLLAIERETDGSVVVLTGALPAAYDHTWAFDASNTVLSEAEASDASSDEIDRVPVHGTGVIESYGAPEVACLTLSGDGTVGVESVAVDGFGLEAVKNVGAKTAGRLAERGITTRADLASCSVAGLRDLPGIGRTRAAEIAQHVTVLTDQEPLRLTDESLPGGSWPQPPLCLDIETDGLSPTMIWQIGVYDPETDDYRAFVERSDPTDPTGILEAFLDWLLGVHADRALITWNGYGFDYEHLTAFVERYLPEYADAWDDYPKLDLYWWCVTQDNALLPGRTNELDHVARALGYEGAETGLSGATTAQAYQRFMRFGEEPDWETHETYCEDDCRKLWHVYERVRDADHATTTRSNSAVNGQQSGLSDF